MSLLSLKKITALCLTLCLFLPLPLAQASAPQIIQAPVNRRVDKNTAKTLDFLPEAARARTDSIVLGASDLLGETNPFFVTTAGDDTLVSLLYDELLFANTKGEAGTGVASFSSSADGLTHTFTLAEGVCYADGTPLRSDDFINAIYLMLMPGYDGCYDISRAGIAGVSAYLAGDTAAISGITRESDSKFSVTLLSANPGDLAYFGFPALRASLFGDMRRPDALETPAEHEAFYSETLEAVRTKDASQMAYGQYFLETLTPGSLATLTKNEGYFRGTPTIGAIEILVVPVGGELDAIMDGTVDIISMIGSTAAVDVAADFESFVNLYTWEGNVIGYLGMNLESPLFADRATRQALAIGLDRDAARQNHVERYGSVPSMLLFDDFSASTSQIAATLREDYRYNFEKADALLTEAGWRLADDGLRDKGGEAFTFTLLYSENNPITEVLVPQMKLDYAKLGISFKTEQVSFEDLTARIASGDYDMYFAAQRLPSDTAIASSHFAGDSHLNQSGFTTDSLQRQLLMADEAEDPARETVVYELFFQELFVEMPFIPLYRRSEFLLVSARIMNVVVTTAHQYTADAYRFFLTDSLLNQW